MTKQQQDELRALAEAATSGPWRNGADPSHFDAPEVTDNKTFSYWVTTDKDAAFIAAANPQRVIALLDQLAAAEAECERLGTLAAARATVQAACRCGSGGHPRECEAHPFAYAAHVAELNELAEINEELSNLRAQLAAVSAARDEEKGRADQLAFDVSRLVLELAAMTKARDEACDIAERRGAVIDYLRRKVDGYDVVFEVGDEIEHGVVDMDGRARIAGATVLPNSIDRIAALRAIGKEAK